MMPRKLGRLLGVAAVAAATAVSLTLSFGFPARSEKHVVPRFVADRSSTVHPSEVITMTATCSDWAAWIPSRSDPAVVMQVVSKDYIDLERNFIRLMERNSALTRHHLFMMCTDDESVAFFETSMGIRCVPIYPRHPLTHQEIWKLRLRVVSCLLEAGRVNVIMSDADALWLGDPVQDLFGGATSPSLLNGGGDRDHRIRESDVVASRGTYPFHLGEAWGSTICMGFILFRADNTLAMKAFFDVMEDLVLETQDDQVSINQAAQELGIEWDRDGDMRYENSTRLGVGTISSLPADDNGRRFGVALLAHSKYTRVCSHTPVSGETTVAHCYFPEKTAGVKTRWMEKLSLWSIQEDP
eukprot:g10382.t1